ncbi:MAG TPA: FAD-dependent oxidoreductase [Microvirga sp.]|jgi:hypothetical protein
MTRPHVHIAGAGVAGLSAALAATRAGAAVTLFEAAPQAGGRCRTLHPADGFSHDNGTHVLFTGNPRAMRLLDEVGARADWVEPEPGGFPVYDGATGRLSRIGLSPWSWLDPSLRPEGLTMGGLLRLARLCLPLPDRPVGAVMGEGPLLRSLVEPLTVAVLNTPVATASARRLGAAMRRLARPGSARLLVSGRGLGPDLVEPALRCLAGRGAALQTGQRLKALDVKRGRVAALVFGDRTVVLGPEDTIVLALPPHEIARLLPGLPVPESYEPILNLHYRFPGPARPRFVGFVGTLAQWALLRADHLSVTVSAAAGSVDEDAQTLAARVWLEIAPALSQLALPADPARPPEARVVKEKRATISQPAGRLPQPPLRPLPNLALAGDWIGTLPATIESAVAAGERAVAALALPRPAAPGPAVALQAAGGTL